MKLFEHQRTSQMKKNYPRFFILFLLFAGCNSATQSPQSVDVIMPLAVGNEWYWDVEYYAPDGTVTGNRKDSLLITSKRTVGGVERYVLRTDPGILDAHISYEGIAFVTYINGYGPYIWVKYPMPLNVPDVISTFVWTTEQSPDPIEDAQEILTYLGNGFSVSTPSGTYSTLKYEYVTRGMSTGTEYFKEYSYYALNVGLVMKETFMPDSVTKQPYMTSRERLRKCILK
ncbi:MAG TPA: hypothetical protein VIX80_07875 [Candidatus Kapabacteria bacterium]